MTWALQLAVILAVPLTLGGAIWAGVRLHRWMRCHPGPAAGAGASLVLSEQLGGFRAWLGDRLDSFAEPGTGDSSGAVDGGDCSDAGDSGGSCGD